MPKKSLTWKILTFLIFSDLLETFTQFCFKKSALLESGISIHGLAALLVFFKGVFISAFLWAGLCSVVLTFVIWSTILSKIDLSVAVPIASFSYILVPLVSIIVLHEKISAIRWLGIFFILAGVIFVSLSSKEKAV
jgi:drug/metabolite transporter (DMT)-like permease